jgi:hypothetical protein
MNYAALKILIASRQNGRHHEERMCWMMWTINAPVFVPCKQPGQHRAHHDWISCLTCQTSAGDPAPPSSPAALPRWLLYQFQTLVPKPLFLDAFIFYHFFQRPSLFHDFFYILFHDFFTFSSMIFFYLTVQLVFLTYAEVFSCGLHPDPPTTYLSPSLYLSQNPLVWRHPAEASFLMLTQS